MLLQIVMFPVKALRAMYEFLTDVDEAQQFYQAEALKAAAYRSWNY